MLFCSYVIYLLRDQWLIERLSEAMGVALVSNNFSPSPLKFFISHIKKSDISHIKKRDINCVVFKSGTDAKIWAKQNTFYKAFALYWYQPQGHYPIGELDIQKAFKQEKADASLAIHNSKCCWNNEVGINWGWFSWRMLSSLLLTAELCPHVHKQDASHYWGSTKSSI